MAKLITISGSDFIYVSDVYFGNYASPSFTVSDDKKNIQAIVPQGVEYGQIKVISKRRGVSGTSLLNFIPVPRIDSYSAAFDTYNQNINNNILSPSGYLRLYGKNFGNISGVFINNILVKAEASGIGNNFDGSDYVDLRVPNGYTRGVFKITSPSGSTTSSFNFNPYIYVSGIGSTPTAALISYTGIPNSLLYINYKSKNPIIMDSPASNVYNVSIGGPISGVYNKIKFSGVTSSYILSGVIPSSGVNGGIRIWDERGGYYENTGISLTIANPPEVYFLTNAFVRTGERQGTGYYQGQTIYLDQSLEIEGNNLQWITGIKYELFDTHTSPVQDEYGSQFLFGVRWGRTVDPNSNKYPKASGWMVSPDGKKLVIPLTGTNYTLPLTGGYKGTSPFVSASQSGLSGSIQSSLVSKIGLGLFALMSPYNVIQICPTGITSGFNLKYANQTNITFPGVVYLGDFRDEYFTGVGAGPVYLESDIMGLRVSEMKVYDYSYTGYQAGTFLGYGVLCSGDPTGTAGFAKQYENDIRNGFKANSGEQVRRCFNTIPATTYAYGLTMKFPAISGWNWYATGTFTQAIYDNVWSGTAAQVRNGWSLSRTVYQPANRLSEYLYLQVSGSKLDLGRNTFTYEILGDNTSYQLVTGVVYCYS